MGISEQKDSQETQQTLPTQKTKAKWPLITAITGGAVLCVGLVAGVIAFNAAQSSTPSSAETIFNSSAIPAADGNTDISLISREGHNISDNPFESSTGSSAAGHSSADASSKGSSASQTNHSSGTPSSSVSSQQEDIRFGENVSVMGVNLKGKTLAEAYDLVQPVVWNNRETVSITVNCEGHSLKLTKDDFNYKTDLSEVLLEAYHYSRKEQTSTTFATTVTRGVTDFEADCWVDESDLTTALQKVYDAYDEPPVNARVTAFHPDQVEKFTYADGHDGYLVDHKLLETKVLQILRTKDKSGSVDLTKKKTAFTVTLADVKANTKLIASHYTTAANVYNSNYNMGLALQSASGTILQPGQIFSFNDTTGDTTNGYTHYYDNGTVGGYLPSTAIVGGKYEQQYGGGICQASTTLYICAMKAGLQAVERYSHAYPSVYCSKGLDATIDYGNLDMRFKNTLKSPVYIATYVYDFDYDGLNELMVEMYGPISAEYDEVVPVGWVDYAGSSSFSAKAAQVYFKNGQEIKRVFLPSGSYDYKYDSYYSVLYEMPNDTDNGPSVSPTKQTPTVFSPGGCGSSAPIPYGTAEAYLKKIADDKKKPQESSKQESSQQESSKPESSIPTTSKPESSAPVVSKPESSTPVTSKPETSKPVTSKPESSAPVVSKPESSVPVSSRPESSVPVSSKPESSTPVTSKPETSKPVTSKPESSVPVSSKPESSTPVSSKPESSTPVSSKPESSVPVSSKPESSTPTSSHTTSSDPSLPESIQETAEVTSE